MPKSEGNRGLQFVLLDRFKDAYNGLDPRIQKKVRKTLERAETDPFGPPVFLKKLKGADNVWTMRAGRNFRLVAYREGNRILLNDVHPHSVTDTRRVQQAGKRRGKR